MHRCLSIEVPARRRLAQCAIAGALSTFAFAALPTSAQAQMQRAFPRDALRGRLLVVQPPEAELNGHAQRLAPGARIRNQNNMLEMSGALGNHVYIVNYTLDTLGQIRDVWILSDAERVKSPWPTTPKQAAEWNFDVQTQTWSRP